MSNSYKHRAPPALFLNPLGTWNGYHFIPLFDVLLSSDNYKALSYPARSLLLFMLSKYDGKSEQFTCTLNEIELAGYSRNHIRRWKEELIKHGFIEIVKCGGHGGNNHRTLYKYSAKWFCKEEAPP